MTEIVYIALKKRVQVEKPIVTIKDVANVYTQNTMLVGQIEKIPLIAFVTEKSIPKNRKKQIKHFRDIRQVVSMLFVVQQIQKAGISHLLLPTGEQNCIVEYIGDRVVRPWTDFLKLFFVCLLCMFGGAFSIMAFHNDISLPVIFHKFYQLVYGTPSNGNTILEFMYSIGLAAGILIFYNHVGKRRISKDPTPIEVSMRCYEEQMNDAMIESWEREGKVIDVGS